MMISVLTSSLSVLADQPCLKDTWGREFYFGVFRPRGFSTSTTFQYKLNIIAKQRGSLSLFASEMSYRYSTHFSQGTKYISLPSSLQHNATNTVNKKAIRATSTVDVTLTLFLEGNEYREGLLVLPADTLATEYIVPGYALRSNNVLIVGLHNSTRFDVRYPSGSSRTYQQLLGEHETFLLSDLNTDESGTRITSTHPIAVFSASTASGPGGNLFEQVIPTCSWGYRYIVPDFYSDSSYYLRVFAQEDNTYVTAYYNSHPRSMVLNKGKFVYTDFKHDPYVLTSSKPIMVMQYGLKGNFMTNVPALSQFSNSYTISLPQGVANYNNFFVLITPEADEAGITFDAPYIPTPEGTSSITVDNVRYVILTYRLRAGLRVFHTRTNAKFGGFAYGYYQQSYHNYDYYAYPIGLTLKEPGCVPPTTSTVSVPVSITTPLSTTRLNETVCFSCQDMSSLIYCDHVQKCDPGKKCFVERHLTSGGETKYSSGCTNICHQQTKRDSSCRQCCSGSYCNNVGCGDTSTPSRNHRGPFCYDCEHVGSLEECHRITLCRNDQVCGVKKYSWGDTLSHFTLGCEEKNCPLSGGSVPFGRRRSVPACERCCQDDFCNKFCG